GGSRTGPNFGTEHVQDACKRLHTRGLAEVVMIDCSHGNSEKDHLRQAVVAEAIAQQVAAGSSQVIGAMLEGHLVEGRQDDKPGTPAVYGQSITDACISWAQTEPLLAQLAKARRTRGTRAA